MQEFLQHTLNGLSFGSIYALVALGYTMVYGILSMINFAHSEIYMMGAFAAFYLARFLGLDTPSPMNFTIGLLGGTLIAGIIGFFVEKFAYKPLRNSPKMNVLITAIGVSILFQFGGQIIFGADPKRFPNLIEDQTLFTVIDIQVHLIDVLIYFVSFVSLAVLSFVIYHTQTGRAMRAVSTRPDMTPLMGINNSKIVSTTFMIGSMLAGVAAVLVSIKYPKIDPMMGVKIGTSSFVAAVFGGIGSLHGAVVGGFLLGLGEYYVNGYGGSTYKEAVSFAILILILLYKPTGLFGSTRKEKI
ncbi:MAG: branched-chain amino acid transporter, permease protein [Pseudobdellovibrio sp.]|jgi:branched-chain amino acid transport system permease protein|nr:branched-chain amino acid transporter, permease protein [Pseudobdellovibrio sp.]